MIRRILEIAMKSAQAAEVYYIEGETRRAEFENNRLKYITTKSSWGAGLRVIRNGRIGFSSTTDLSKPDELAAHALESAIYGQEARFAFPAKTQATSVSVHDRKVIDFPIEEGVKRTAAAIDAVLAVEPRVQCGGDVTKRLGRKRIINSAGLDVGYEFTDFDCSLSALLVRDGSLLNVGDHDASCALTDKWEAQTRKVIADINAARREVVPDAGVYSIIFTPDAMDALIISFEQGVNGKLVQKQISPFTGRLGEQIVDNRITITDDGTIAYAAGSSPVDCEGLPVRRNVLFDKGVLKSFIFDMQTAGLLGVEPTGNGTRSYNRLPVPDIANLVVATGDTSFEQMVASTKRGIVVDQLLGAGQSNTLAGEFSANVDLGFLVENGEMIGRVKDCMVAGNVFELFKNSIIALGNASQLKGDFMCPHFHIAGINVASG